MKQRSTIRQLLQVPVIVAALGYFVDIYDLLLFSIVRVDSLRSLGVGDSGLLGDGVYLINMQMGGLFLGGILWGILGDKRGRISVLFGSILIYSLSNLANGFVTSVHQYAVLRFIAGIGLAGELGVGITLVAEILPREIRGYGTSLVAGVGMMGAVLAYNVAEHFDWRVTYFIGGGLGLLLLIMRVRVFESGIFNNVKEKTVTRGDFLQLFTSAPQFSKYLRCILIGIPVWFVAGILMTFSPEIGAALHLDNPIVAGKAVMWEYVGLVIGDISSGIISQYFRSRKKVVLLYILLATVLVTVYLFVPLGTDTMFYLVCTGLGIAAGYWALFVTIAAEQFGTNMRATVATTAPNFVRGSIILMTPLFLLFKDQFGILYGAGLVGLLAIGTALLGLWKMEETFGRDLDFVEITSSGAVRENASNVGHASTIGKK
ncbi:MFS transporter [Parapedobacter koreensis]|uniref:Predicted arabinose efflux permease, MFS family n=1 Tax=Parapedobacter koreensis TaxID=332977 RepID=A0A1H7TF82_9SPHI|nr:MFS transporter [Parapedobacter koreensis]SEL82966.1 Predicted arabinose efflux permease, MFS family [Parapedobacter koreensis]